MSIADHRDGMAMTEARADRASRDQTLERIEQLEAVLRRCDSHIGIGGPANGTEAEIRREIRDYFDNKGAS